MDDHSNEHEADDIMGQVRALGHYPKRKRTSGGEENNLAKRLAAAKKAERVTPEQTAELELLSLADARAVHEAQLPVDPLNPFADEAQNRIEQDLLMANNGFRQKEVMRRVSRYKRFLKEAGANDATIVGKYKEQVFQAAASFRGLLPYVPGDQIVGDDLRSFSEAPVITGPLVCQLCEDASFLYDEDFAAHKDTVHCGENEYRKRVIF